ncbi:MAG: PIG-L family deacetylase [Nitrospira sp.]|nr:PIG-L family deacetylase [Nitrospira sp.]
MLQESDIIPYHISQPAGEKVLVLAPHPDDETLGCGGTIRLLLESKKSVKVVFLTSGDKADPSNKLSKIRHRENPPLHPEDEQGFRNTAHLTEYALLREKEAAAALNVLCVSDYLFLRFPDRELHKYFKSARERLLQIIKEYLPDTIYSPSPVELNPDHRTAATLSLEIQRTGTENSRPERIIFYEVTTPLRPNMLIDITSAYRRKKRAIKKYRTQLRLIDYLGQITSLNVLRTLTVKGPKYAEAFWCVNEGWRRQDLLDWLGYKGIITEEIQGN